MGQRRKQIRPAQVYKAARQLLQHRILPDHQVQVPLWYRIVESIPPSETLTRSYPTQHIAADPRIKRPKKLYQPQQITYEEDALRKQFYKDHPWELARPRMIIEMDGKDAQRYDWSRGLLQPGMPLCGESVVQWQMWLMHNKGLTTEQAYDKARHAFYLLRQEEDIERRVAKEEARMMGSYFGKSFLQVGMELEDRTFENWKKWAAKEIETIERDSTIALTTFGFENEDPAQDAEMDVEAELAESR